MRFPPLRLLFICFYVGLSAYACTTLGDDDTSGDSYAGEAAQCVVDLPEDAICTLDFNECGFGSVCSCGDGYDYNAALGKCVLRIQGLSSATPTRVSPTACVRPGTDLCTRDINVCGQPSTCSCDEGFIWNSVVGACVRTLR